MCQQMGGLLVTLAAAGPRGVASKVPPYEVCAAMHSRPPRALEPRGRLTGERVLSRTRPDVWHTLSDQAAVTRGKGMTPWANGRLYLCVR